MQHSIQKSEIEHDRDPLALQTALLSCQCTILLELARVCQGYARGMKRLKYGVSRFPNWKRHEPCEWSSFRLLGS